MRPPISKDLAAKLMVANLHRCCICREPRKHVQIHHINEDASNNDWSNLAVLCLDCHSRISGDEGFGRSFTQQEVSIYKDSWEEQCKKWLTQSISSPEIKKHDEVIESDYLDEELEAETNLEQRYSLEDGQGIMIWIKSELPIDLAVMRKSDYKKWSVGKLKLEDATELQIEEAEETKEFFLCKDAGKYSVVIINNNLEDTWIQSDISTWSFN